MVVNGGKMKERNKFMAAEGFNAQLKKQGGSKNELMTVGGRRLKLTRFSRGSVCRCNFDSFSTVNGKYVELRCTDIGGIIVQPTTYQKVRRIIEEHNERQSHPSSSSKVLQSSSSNSLKSRELSNYSIVASNRSERRQNNRKIYTSGFSSFSVCETPAALSSRSSNITGSGNTRRKKSEREGFKNFSIKNSRLPNVVEYDKKKVKKTGVKVTLVREKESKELSWGPVISGEKKNGYLIGNQKKFLAKLPSAFLERDEREAERKTAQISRDNGNARDFSATRTRSEVCRSSSTNLPNSWKKPARVGVKKSVSFSSDTSFQEKKSIFFNKTHVHEAKVYHKGVLQDRTSPIFESLRNTEATSLPTTTTTTTTTPGSPLALVRAARDGSNATLRQMMARAKTPLGTREVDINAVDASGRTAVSYLAGDGAVAMLEAALSFPDIDVNLSDNEGNTPLHFAAQAGQLECVSILLQRCSGIEVDARNTLGFTPLMKAAIQGRTKCAKILLFAGANPTLRDYGRGLRAEQWARFCGRYVCAEVIERFARHRLLERSTSCRWGSEPELAAKVLQGKVTPIPMNLPQQSSGLRSKIRRVFRTSSGPDNRSFSLVSQLTSAALCASSPALPRHGEIPPVVKSLLRPLSVPQLKITLVPTSDGSQIGNFKTGEKIQTNFTEKIVSEKIESNSVSKPPRSKKKTK